MQSESKNYELAYILSSSIPEEEVSAWAGKLATLIQDSKGMIRHTEEPKKRRLAYVIKKEQQGYFGWITFAGSTNTVAELEKKVKTFEKLLRHLIVIEREVQQQPLRIIPSRPMMPSHPRPSVPHDPNKPEEKFDLESLDKKLEEILGK